MHSPEHLQTEMHVYGCPLWSIAVLPCKFLFVLCLIFCSGCSTGPPAVSAPSIDPESATESLFQLCDIDGNGTLTREESHKSQSFWSVFSVYDKNHNDELTRDEVRARLEVMVQGNVGLIVVPCKATYQGKPLSNASLKITGAEFLGRHVLPEIESTTDQSGTAILGISEDELPANLRGKNCKMIPPGIYEVTVVHPRFESSTKKLGCEVFPEGAMSIKGITLNLE